MATQYNRIIHKKSSVSGKVPNTGDILYGEFAVNYNDGRIYYKNSDGSVQYFEQINTTDDLAEGASNLYYTNDRVNAYLQGGTGVTVNSGVISIDQDVGTTSSVQFADITANQILADSLDVTTFSGNGSGITGVDAATLDGLDSTQFIRSDSDSTLTGNLEVTGDLLGPSTFTIDPATHGDDTGTVVIAGDLQVNGTTTTVNSESLTVTDLTITVADSATTGSEADGAGLLVGGTNASLLYDESKNGFDLSPALYLPNGAATDPTYSFSSDPDTGMYRYGDNAIGISVGGSDGWVIGEAADGPDFVVFGILQTSELEMVKKITPTGSTGDTTLNYAAGSVNLGAGDTSLTVTNNLVDADSIVIGTVASPDATTKSVQIVPSFGQFVIFPDEPPTSETRINFMVLN